MLRSLIAALSLLTLTNLAFVQAMAACPLAHGTTGHAAAQSPDMHTGHPLSAHPGHELAQSTPDTDSSHHVPCLTMGPCGLTLDVAVIASAAPSPAHAIATIGGPDRLPASPSTAPELPPPRA